MPEISGLLRFARGAGIAAGGIAGAIGALNAVRVTAEHKAVDRVRRQGDPYVDEPFGAQAADRDYTVVADDGTPLYVEEVGPLAAPVVLIFAHGHANALGSFHFQRRNLAKMRSPQIRMVFFDQRSHGRSGRSDPEHSTIDQLGSDLGEIVRNATDDQQVILVGHSMGGMSIMGLADSDPQLFGTKVLGVVLISTAAESLFGALREGLPKTVVQRAIPVLAKGAQLAPKLTEAGRRRVGNAMWLLNRKYSFGSHAAPASLTDYVNEMINHTPIGVVADFSSTFTGYDKVAALPALRECETLVICGDEDRIAPMEHSELIHRELPDSQLVVVPGAGHMVHLEMPDVVNMQIRRFVHRVTETRDRKSSQRA
ncbi:MAG: alpha/beta hydrolase [Antricoccus sp.]